MILGRRRFGRHERTAVQRDAGDAGRANPELVGPGLVRPEPAAPAIGAHRRAGGGGHVGAGPADEVAFQRRPRRRAREVDGVEVFGVQALGVAGLGRAERPGIGVDGERVVVDAPRLQHGDPLAQEIPQPLRRGLHTVGHHPRTAAALEQAARGVGTDQGDRLQFARQRQQAVVLQQRHGLAGRVEGDGLVAGRAQLSLRPFRAVQQSAAEDQADHAGGVVVDLGLGNVSRPDRGQQLVAEPLRRPGHLEVEAGVGRGGGGMGGGPVRDHHAPIAPLFLEDVGQQAAVFGGVGSVELVVGGHDRPGVGLRHDPLEGGEIEFPQGPLVDAGVDDETLQLLIVGGVVLERRADPLALEPLHIGRAHDAGQVRVLGIGLEVPAPGGDAHHVDRGRQHHMIAQRMSLTGDGRGDGAGRLRVPGRGDGDTHGKDRRGDAADRSYAGGPVGHLERRHAQALDRIEIESAGARQQRDLLLQGETGHQVVDAVVEGGRGIEVDLCHGDSTRP